MIISFYTIAQCCERGEKGWHRNNHEIFIDQEIDGVKEKEKECLREIEVENGGEDGYSGVAAEVKTMAVAAKVMAEVVVGGERWVMEKTWENFWNGDSLNGKF